MNTPRRKLPDRLAEATGLPRSHCGQVFRLLSERGVLSLGGYGVVPNTRDAVRVFLGLAAAQRRDAPDLVLALVGLEDGSSSALDALERLVDAAVRPYAAHVPVDWDRGSIRIGRTVPEVVLTTRLGDEDVVRTFRAADHDNRPAGPREFIELPLSALRGTAKVVLA